MGHGNVRALNRLGGPVNTFARPADARSSKPAPTVGPAPKRQKIESPSRSGHITSRYFTSNNARNDVYDPVQSSFHDDLVELKSISSTTSNYNKVPMRATVPEFRHAQSTISGRSRKRRRRRSSRPTDTREGCGDDDSLRGSSIPDSPDVLAIDDGEPPPANVISDITRPGKGKQGRQSSFSEPHVVKRQKPASQSNEPIDLSEDELQSPSRVTKTGRASRRTNFSDLQPRNPPRVKSRGDIPSTEFRPSKDSSSSSAKEDRTITLSRAASGSKFWEPRRGQRANLIPRYRDDNSVAYFDLSVENLHGGMATEDGSKFKSQVVNRSMPWLQIRVDKIQDVDHQETHSKYVRIRKRLTPGAPPSLFLEFGSKEDAGRFIACLPGSLLNPTEEERLKKMFDVAMEQASGQSSPDCVLAEGETVPQTSVVVEIPQRASSRNAQPQTRGKLKDRMLRADHTSKLDSPETPKAIPVQPTGRYETRRTRRSSPKPTVNHMSPDPDGWTLKNPDWKSRWHQSLVYPATGKNRATVDAEDINRLDEGEYLNDNIISFYLRYLQVKLEEQRPEILKKVYIFNSFFFEKLKDPKTRYEGVRTWTAKVDLLSYDYIVVPVNEHAHWYLAIICNVARALPAHDSRDEKEEAEYSTTVKERVSSSPKVALVDERKSISLDEEPPAPPSAITGDQNATLSSPSRPSSNSQNNLAKWKPRRSIGGPGRRFDPSEPRIITLDSLGGSHSVACKVLKDYLAEEARDKKGVELALIPSGMTGKGIPEQDNFCDCGVFILGYMEEFLKNPDEASRRLLQKEPLEWDIKPSQLRSNIRDLLFTLQQEQQERLRKEREEKRRAKRLWAASNSQLASPSPGNIVSSKPSQEPPSRQSLARSQRSSPSAGLTSKQPSEIMEGSETLDAPPVSGSAERLQACPQSQSSVFDGTEPRLISRLVDDENPSGKDGQSTDSFYSARSTPGGEDHKVRQHRTIESKSPKGRFVERIPSSGSEDNNPQRKPRMPIRETIEVDDDDDDDIMPTRAPKNPSLRQSSSPLVAAPSPKWPSYDGIYRCPSRD